VKPHFHQRTQAKACATQTGAIILAAGASKRMGRPKPLLELDGETFLDRLIGRFYGICAPIVVVLGYEADRIRAGIRNAGGVEFVVNPSPERGMLSSLQCGLASLPGDAAAVLFTPADLPSIRRSTIAVVAASAVAMITIPRCGGRNGHPVRISRGIMAELLALPEDAQARDVLHRHREDTLFIEIHDPGILHDVDTPTDYEALIAGPGVRA
jgi:molybdenum cofactor cytidylyltransferase